MSERVTQTHSGSLIDCTGTDRLMANKKTKFKTNELGTNMKNLFRNLNQRTLVYLVRTAHMSIEFAYDWV